MDFNNTILKKLIEHNVLKLERDLLEKYRVWFDSYLCDEKCDWLLSQFHLFKKLPHEVDKSLQFLVNKSSVGINWSFKDEPNQDEPYFFMELFRDKIQSIGYQKQLADKRIFETPSGTEIIERYYLKAPFKLVEGNKILQQFGNILLSNTFVNGEHQFFQCLCHFFQDRSYTSVGSIHDLFEIILEK